MTDTRTLTRPASVPEWLEREQARAPSLAESAQHGMACQPQPSDLFIAPYAKCGATWLQQIVHGLRTRGDMNVDEVMQVMPWLEMAHYGDHRTELPVDIAGEMDAIWREIVESRTGLASYRALRAALA